MSSLTPNYQFILPGVNNAIDANIWGGQLNSDFSNLDDILTSVNASNIGATPPIVPATAAPTAGMLWLDTSAGGDFYFLKIYDGTDWATIGSLNTTLHEFSQNNLTINTQILTATGTYTPSTGLTFAKVIAIGGGGAGGGGVQGGSGASAGAGGGAGSMSVKYYTAAQLGASQPITIGAGGTGIILSNGGNGTVTTFASGGLLLTANGGIGGGIASAFTTSASAGGAGGTATGGIINIAGSCGLEGFGHYQSFGNNYACAGNGGDSPLGGGGGRGGKIVNTGSIDAAIGQTGINYGAGGGGSSTMLSGVPDPLPGNGGAGVIIVEEYF